MRGLGMTETTPIPMTETTPIPVLGVNFEGGKHVAEAASSPSCVAAYNCQVSMDAPFEEGQAAPEHLRQLGRTEQRLGVLDSQLQEQLRPVFAEAASKASAAGAWIVVQITRGRSAHAFFLAVVEPLLAELKAIPRCAVRTGYRSADHSLALSEPFVFITVGMFGRLTPGVSPGVVHAVETTFVVDDASTPAEPRRAVCLQHATHDEALKLLPPCRMISLPDHFPFVTPEEYVRDRLIGIASAGSV